MSYETGFAVVRGRGDPHRIAVMEHVRGLSRQAIIHFCGIDPVREPARLNEAFRRIVEVFEVDLLWGGGLPVEGDVVFDWDNGPSARRDQRGREVVQWGIFAATHQEDGRHFTHIPRPADVDQALAFDPLAWFPDTVADYQRRFTAQYEAMQRSTGEGCLPLPHHYTTCFHWALGIFGFELLCEAGMQEERFAALMQRFAQVSTRITTAWSRVPGLEGFILHDDLTMSSGPIFSPDWYRRHIFIHYPAIFAPLKDEGVPIIFTSDGDCTCFIDDIFNAGADGLNFEYLVDLESLAARYPDKILIGNINSATLARGPRSAIEAETQRCIEAGRRAPRFVVNVGGGLTHDIPIEHLECYLELRRRLTRRETATA